MNIADLYIETEPNMKENTTYLVMEVHSAYAVLLDNEGRFIKAANVGYQICLLYTSPSPRDRTRSRMPSSA